MSNIQVVVRCRERNERELNAKSQVVVELPSDSYSIVQPTITINQNNSTQLTQKILNSLDSKTYNFDQVYGPLADQQLIFNKVVSPLFKDFLKGFNITILAYGQTGTGKTFTMCGKNEFLDKSPKSNNTHQVVDKDSGIIPRVINELFNTLNNNDDFIIKCSFIELYNENLKDLLDDDNDKNLKIFENRTSNDSFNGYNNHHHNNNNSILISNLKEIMINDLASGFKLLQSGLLKRKIASTKLNNFSSRSHTIFTIHLFKKSGNKDEYFRYSKINLVDLAGLENINKSGSINQRAKEAGSINQSLLTLGRVINSLSGKNNNNISNGNNNLHIPYRESKLTRLLQDSIGGKTKTLLISTISPAKINLEETLSTLEYSLKVKNIENKPQLGQDFQLIMKKTLVKDLSNEIIKLNNDLISTRNKNGIYMNELNYNNLIEEHNSNKNEINELKLKLKSYEVKLKTFETTIKNFEQNEIILNDKINDYKEMNETLNNKLLHQKDNIYNSIELINNLTNNNKLNNANNQKLNNLNQSLKTNLILLKLNFNNNYSSINKDFLKSLNNLPDFLIELVQDLNKNDENFKKFSNNQLENFEKINLINKTLNEYLINYSIDINSIISKFITNSTSIKLDNLKSTFEGHFKKLLNQEFTNISTLLEQEMNELSAKVMQENKSTIIAKTNNWNSNATNLINDSVSCFNNYGKNLENLSNTNQNSINKTSNELKSTLNSIISSNLLNLKTSFVQDLEKIDHVVPEFDQNLKLVGDLLTTDGNSVGKLNELFDSPLREFNQNLPRKEMKSPSKSPRKSLKSLSKSHPIKSDPSRETLDKENVPTLKKPRII